MSDNFLPPEAPPTASARQIDFTTTTPPIPKYARLFAGVIDDILTEEECNEFIRRAEATTIPPNSTTAGTPAWERAMINIGSGRQALDTETRNCGRIILDDTVLTDKLLTRLMPFLKKWGIDQIENQLQVTGLRGRGKRYHLTRLNERLRFLKYEGGEYFRPHGDASYVTPDGKERSFYTIHLYLNGEGEQDLEELRGERRRMVRDGEVNRDVNGRLLGGATSFIARFEDEENEEQVRVFPRTGSVLVFQQMDLIHGGDPVFRGTKYTMRTDIMYRQE